MEVHKLVYDHCLAGVRTFGTNADYDTDTNNVK